MGQFPNFFRTAPCLFIGLSSLMLSKIHWLFRLLPLALTLPLATKAQVNLTVNAAQPIRTVDERVFGVNAVIWDAQASSAQTISMVQNAGIRTIRVPGGSLSDEYHWRINKSLANTWTWATAFNGFINLITSANTQAVVTVNYGSGTPEEAAGLVAYLNASVGSSTAIGGTDGTGFAMQNAGYWAALRAAAPLGTDDGMNFLRISRSSPVEARYFEIGNECYGTWETDQQAAAHDPTTYANRVQQYIAKMKAVDPTIKIGVVVVTSSENASYKNWTPTMLARLKTLNAIPDFIIYHLYPQAPGAESDAALLQVADTGSKSWSTIAADLRQQLTANLGSAAGAGVEIVVTENNSVYSSPGKQSTSLVNGLYLADSIGNLMQTEINGYMYWALRNGPPTINNGAALDGNMSASLYGWRQFGDYGMISTPSTLTGEATYYNPYPTYYMMKLLSHFARGGDTIVQATSSNPLLSIFAAKRTDGSLSLLVINKDPTNAQNANITLNNYGSVGSATFYSYGKPQDSAGSAGDLVVSPMDVTGTTFSFSFASYSGTVINVNARAPVEVSAANDFDHDGQSDLFWQNTVTGERSFWLMNGTTFKVGVSLGMFAPDWTIVGSGDFNSDGQTDLLWQNTITGERTIWLMNGTSFSLGVDLGTYSTDIRIMASGDFNDDGQTDIVVENTITGEATVWLMNGTAKTSEVSLGVRPTSWSIAGTGDFNGDGKVDLIWQNAATGERAVWLMNGTAMSSNVSLGVVGKQFQIVGTGDYNRDGKTDLVWTDTATGDRTIWLMDGLVHSATITLPHVSPEWSLDRPIFLTAQTAHADFNGDGQTDMIVQNGTTGERTISFMSGASITSTMSLITTTTDWVIAGTGDFNHDDKPDLVWSNTVTGERTIWLMDGTTKLSNVPLTTLSPTWVISAIGDFNYDGKPDIVWSNTATGERAIWLMNGTVFGSGVSVGTVSTEWKIATTADLNGDGKTDLIWQNTATGESSVWLMNGGSLAAGVVLDALSPQWSIVGTGDFNADGKADLLLQNTVTGERVVRLMNRSTLLSTVSLGIYSTDLPVEN